MRLAWILVALLPITAANEPTGWEAVSLYKEIDADLESSFLKITTESEQGSDDTLDVTFYNVDEGEVGGLMMKFATNGMMYNLFHCHKVMEFHPFPTNANLPPTKGKEWIVEKRGLNIKVYCNGKLVLDQTISSDICDADEAWQVWGKTVTSFTIFDASPTDSFYIGQTNACADNTCSHYCYNTGIDDKPYTCGCPDGLKVGNNDLVCVDENEPDVVDDVVDEVEQDVVDEEDCEKSFSCDYSKATAHAVSVALIASILAIAQFF